MVYKSDTVYVDLKHESKRVFQITLERSHPACTNCSVNSPMIRAQCDLHDISCFEAALFFWGRDDNGLGRTDGKDTGLWGVDNCREMVDLKHAQVRNSERSTLSV